MKHILLVEDDLSLLNGLSFAIKKQSYALDIARTRDGQKQFMFLTAMDEETDLSRINALLRRSEHFQYLRYGD